MTVTVATLGAALGLLSCFDPTYPANRVCGPDQWCPPGQECVDGVCRLPGTMPPPPPPPDATPPGIDAALDDSALLSLHPSAGMLAPAFDPETTAYMLSVSELVQALSWIARPANADAVVRIDDMAIALDRLSPPIPVIDGSETSIEVTGPTDPARTYAVTVKRDASIAQDLYIKASNTGAGDHFGHRVALDGDTVVVGAPGESSSATGVDGNQGSDGAAESGAAYVFRWTDTGWAQEAYLKAAATDAQDQLGYAVAVDGDTVAVGVPGDDSGNPADPTGTDAQNSGAVYVFRRTASGWAQEAYLKASNLGVSDGDQLGLHLALDGDTLAVGAPYEDSGDTGPYADQSDESAANSGAVYVFRRSGTTWSQEAYLKASNTGANDEFGFSVALAGDVLVAGAHFESSDGSGVDGAQDNDNLPRSGAAYVFRRSGITWVQEAYLKASNTGSDDGFGHRVAVTDTLIAVSAIGEDSDADGVDGLQDDDNAEGSGAVYVFGRDAGDWVQVAYLKASNSGAGDDFGAAVSMRGALVAVGAPGEGSIATGVDGVQDDDGAPRSGAVYLYQCTAACAQVAYLKPSNTGENDELGRSVSLSDDGLAVGAAFEDSDATGLGGSQDDGSRVDSGAAYLFH